jgi:arylsulfate sulfotransferase
MPVALARDGHGVRRRLAIVATALALLAAACSDDGGGGSDAAGLVTNVGVAKAPNSELTAVVTVETEDPSRVTVTAESDGHEVAVPETEELATTHEVPLLGLRAGTTYDVAVTAVDEDGGRETAAAVEHTSGPLPETLPDLEIETDPERMAPGVTLFNLMEWTESGRLGPEGVLVALDEEGEIVWYYQSPRGISDVSPTPRGTLLLSANDVVIQEIDMLGNTLRELGTRVATEYVPVNAVGASQTTEATEPIAIDSAHHELYELPSGNLLTLSTEVVELDEATAAQVCPENPSTAFVGDVVVELTPDGEVVQEWPISAVYDPAVRPGASACGEANPVAPPNWFYPHVDDTRDWTHGNAVVLDEEANALLVSLRHLDAVVALRYQDDESGPAGALLWELGPDGTLTLEGDGELSYHQHAVEPHDDGTLLLYDNGNFRPGTESAGGDQPDYSRAVEYEIDVESGTARQVWEHQDVGPDGNPVYAYFLSDADQLENGNVLITHGGIEHPETGGLYARLVEVVPEGDSGGDVVFDVTVGDGSGGGWTVYRADRLPTLSFAGLDLS